MNKPKWKIRKYPKLINGKESNFPWKAFRPGVTPPENPLDALWACETLKGTFSEVIRDVNYELGKPRTVEVVLPKVEKSKCINPTMSPAMFVEKTPGNYGIFLGHRHMLTVTAEELKPLGEYLLALHYEKENK